MKCFPEVELERDALGTSADDTVQYWELGGAGSWGLDVGAEGLQP